MGGYSNKQDNTILINFNGVPYRGFKGQSIASLLFSCGIRGLRNCKNGEERGVFCGMGVCYDCTVSINGVNFPPTLINSISIFSFLAKKKPRSVTRASLTMRFQLRKRQTPVLQDAQQQQQQHTVALIRGWF